MNTRLLALIGIASVVGIAILRAAVLFAPDAPSGIDGGNWLAFGTFERVGMTYPPLVPVAFATLVGIVGPAIATAVAGAAATALPALAVLAVLAWARRPVAGALAALVIVSSRAIGEVAAWGGYPQPTATACTVIALVALTDWLANGSRWALACFALAMAGVVAASHLVAVPAAGAVALLLVGAVIISPRAAWRRAVAAACLALLPLVLLAPTYRTMFATLGGIAAGRSGDAERILGLGWPLYVVALLVVPLGAAHWLKRRSLEGAIGSRDSVVLIAAAAGATSWLLAYLVSGEPRLIHDAVILAMLGIAALVPVVGLLRGTAAVRTSLAILAVAVAVVLAMTGLSVFPDQVAYYHVLDRDETAAIEWLATTSSSTSPSILVADERGVPVGWWVEGLTGQEVLFASDLRWLRFPSERNRAITANELLYASGFPSAESVAAVRDAGVEYVLLPNAAAFGIDPASPPGGWKVVFSSGDAVVLVPVPAAHARLPG